MVQISMLICQLYEDEYAHVFLRCLSCYVSVVLLVEFWSHRHVVSACQVGSFNWRYKRREVARVGT